MSDDADTRARIEQALAELEPAIEERHATQAWRMVCMCCGAQEGELRKGCTLENYRKAEPITELYPGRPLDVPFYPIDPIAWIASPDFRGYLALAPYEGDPTPEQREAIWAWASENGRHEQGTLTFFASAHVVFSKGWAPVRVPGDVWTAPPRPEAP